MKYAITATVYVETFNADAAKDLVEDVLAEGDFDYAIEGVKEDNGTD